MLRVFIGYVIYFLGVVLLSAYSTEPIAAVFSIVFGVVIVVSQIIILLEKIKELFESQDRAQKALQEIVTLKNEINKERAEKIKKYEEMGLFS